MGEGVWRTRFGADPSVVGREIRLNGQPFTVIGVVPDHAQLARPARVWSLMRPVAAQPSEVSGSCRRSAV